MTPHYFKRGIYTACGIAGGFAALYFVIMGLAFDGRCGGFFPGVSAPRACSLWNYLAGDAVALAMVVIVTAWPLVLAVLILPPALGYWLERRGKTHGT